MRQGKQSLLELVPIFFIPYANLASRINFQHCYQLQYLSSPLGFIIYHLSPTNKQIAAITESHILPKALHLADVRKHHPSSIAPQSSQMAAVSYHELSPLPSPNPALTPDLKSDTSYRNTPTLSDGPFSKSENSGWSYENSPQTASSAFGTPNPNASSYTLLKPNPHASAPAPGQVKKHKRWLRILQIAAKACTVLFSAIIFGIIVYIEIEFQTTKGVIRGGRGPWPENPKLWPTYMFLATSGVTLLVSVVVLVAYCCCYEKARTSIRLTLLNYVIHIGVWITVTFLYRYERSLHGNDNDLWGWACNTKLQPQFEGVLDFKTLCTAQVSFSGTPAWYHVHFSLMLHTDELVESLDRRVRGQGRFCRCPFYHLSQNTEGREAASCRWPGRCILWPCR